MEEDPYALVGRGYEAQTQFRVVSGSKNGVERVNGAQFFQELVRALAQT